MHAIERRKQVGSNLVQLFVNKRRNGVHSRLTPKGTFRGFEKLLKDNRVDAQSL